MLTRPQGTYPDAGCYEFPVPAGISENTLPSVTWNEIFEEENIFLFDLSGKKIFTGVMLDLPRSTLPEAVYIISTTDGEKILKTFLIR